MGLLEYKNGELIFDKGWRNCESRPEWKGGIVEYIQSYKEGKKTEGEAKRIEILKNKFNNPYCNSWIPWLLILGTLLSDLIKDPITGRCCNLFKQMFAFFRCHNRSVLNLQNKGRENCLRRRTKS